jgi:hypothetical protein
MVDPASAYFIFRHLCLGSFATIYEVAFLQRLKNMCSRVSVPCRNSGIITKYGECQHCLTGVENLLLKNKSNKYKRCKKLVDYCNACKNNFCKCTIHHPSILFLFLPFVQYPRLHFL